MKKPSYRISNAALGKHLAAIIETGINSNMTAQQFQDTIHAIYNSILDPDYEPDTNSDIDQTVYDEQRALVEKSARRSAAAREAARRRREAKINSDTEPQKEEGEPELSRKERIAQIKLERSIRNYIRRLNAPPDSIMYKARVNAILNGTAHW